MRHQRPCRCPLRSDKAALALWATPVHASSIQQAIEPRYQVDIGAVHRYRASARIEGELALDIERLRIEVQFSAKLDIKVRRQRLQIGFQLSNTIVEHRCDDLQ